MGDEVSEPTDLHELVQELRWAAESVSWSDAGQHPVDVIEQAADTIERLTADNARLRHLLAGDVSWLLGFAEVVTAPDDASSRRIADINAKVRAALDASDGAT